MGSVGQGETGEARSQPATDVELVIDRSGVGARRHAARCARAAAAVEQVDPERAVLLRSAQVVALSVVDLAAAATLAAELRERARALGTPSAIAYAEVAWGWAHPGPEHLHARLDIARSALAQAPVLDLPGLVPAAQALLLVGLLEEGSIHLLDASVLHPEEHPTGGSGSTTGAPARWFRCLRSILDGDVERAEREANEIYQGAVHEGTDALALYTTQIGMIRWMQGRVDQAEDRFLQARRAYPEQLLWPASLAWLWMLQGRRVAAEALLRSLPAPEDLPRDRYWHSTITVLAEIATMGGDRDRAEALRELMVPYADRLVPVGVGIAFWGTSARTLGLLEERLGMLDDARRHLALAVELAGRVGAQAWLAEAQIELASFGLRHDLADVDAYGLLAEARATCAAQGFAGLAQRAIFPPRIRVFGRFEVRSVDGHLAEWTSRKARDLLKMLVAASGVATPREVFMDLLWPGVAPEELTNRFSVAVSAIRRAFDPQRLLPTQHHLVTDGDAVYLDIDHVDIDLERFLSLAEARSTEPSPHALRLYRGDAFAEDLYEDWARPIREHARDLFDELG